MDKTIKLLEEFLKDYTMEGTCGFLVQPDEDGGIPSVYIIFDLDWVYSLQTKPDFVARRMRQGLKEDIKNWTGVDVPYVGSTAKKCDKTTNLSEQLSPEVRRRINLATLKDVIDVTVHYEFEPCSHEDVGEFVANVCDTVKDIIINNIEAENNLKEVLPKDKDTLYYFLVDNFGKHLVNLYKEKCVKGLKESKKRIIVTESQYRRLFEEKKTKKEVFQELIDEKLQYLKDSCDKMNSDIFPNDVGYTSCDFVDMIQSIKVDEVNMMTGARTDMYGNKYDSTPSIFIELTINYQTMRNYHDFDEVIFDIKHMLRKSTGGLPIVLDYRTNNLKTTNEW